jgi:hypothetical protein
MSVTVRCQDCKNSEKAPPPWDLGITTFAHHAEQMINIHRQEFPDHNIGIQMIASEVSREVGK